MSHLIQKHQQTDKGTGVLRRRYLTPKQEEEFRKQYRSYTTQSSDNTSVTDTKKQIAKANTPERIQKRRQAIQIRDFKKNQEEAEKIYRTVQQYEKAQQEASTDTRWNPRAWTSDISKVPLFGLPATIAKATYAGMNWLTGNQGKARYWWEDTNRDATGQTIALGAIPAHTNPYTAALYDGILLGPYVKELDQQGKFRGNKNLSFEDYANLAMATIPAAKIKFADPTLQRMYINGEKTSGNATLGTIFRHKLETGKITQQELAQVVGATQSKWVFKNLGPLKVGHGDVMKYKEIINRAVKSLEQGGKRQSNAGVRAAEEATLLQTPEGQYQLLRNKQANLMEQYKNRTRQLAKEQGYNFDIDFDAEMGGDFSSMPLEFKISPVPEPNGQIIDKRPFIQRYYENVNEWNKPGGLVEQVIKSGRLRTNENGQLIGLMDDGTWRLVNGRQYIISQLPNYRASGTQQIVRDITKSGQITSRIPKHGTPSKSKIQERFSDPSAKALFTVIDDDMPGVSSMQNKYTNNSRGVAIPFHRKIETFETRPMTSEGGINNSNNFGVYGELKHHFETHGGKASEVRQVSDPSSSGMRVNEYNFGVGTPDIKSLWNTGDYKPGGSPFAYIESLRDSYYG